MRIGNEVIYEEDKILFEAPYEKDPTWVCIWKKNFLSYDRPSGRHVLPGYSIVVFSDAFFRTVYVAKVGAERHSVYASDQAPWDGQEKYFIYRNALVGFDEINWQAVKDRLLSHEGLK